MQQPFQGPVGTMELIALTPQLGRYFGTDHGVLVVRAPTHGVLQLQDGDVILSIGGRVPVSSSQAIRILTSYDPGQEIKLLILREHHRIDITATMPPATLPPAPPEHR
jgi:S1-C subfamily serine protease